jgi:hypothetical protein
VPERLARVPIYKLQSAARVATARHSCVGLRSQVIEFRSIDRRGVRLVFFNWSSWEGDVLLTREEMTFDFGGARFDPVADRPVLGWLMNQFLYGEVAANQIGEWLYEAPDLEAARFLARQAVEELQHVDSFLRIMRLLGTEPGPAHPVVRLLVTGLKASSWPEHVALIMAAGEGMVLMIFYALIDTLDHAQAVEILRRSVRQEERHVDFGERTTMRVIEGRPRLRRRLLGLNLSSLWAVRRLAASMERKFGPADSAVMRRLPEFARAVATAHELRLRRMGVLDRPLADVPLWRQVLLVVQAHSSKLLGAAVSSLAAPLRAMGLVRRRRLTDVYLADPALHRPAASEPDGEAPYTTAQT